MRTGILGALRCDDGRLLARGLAALLALSALLGAFAPAASASPLAGLHCLTGTAGDPGSRPATDHLACCLLGCLGAPLIEPPAPRLEGRLAVGTVEAPLLLPDPPVLATARRAGGESPRGPPAAV